MTDYPFDDTSVRVAVRIRPQLPKERIDLCRVCTSVTPGEPQVQLGKDKAFTFDFAFDVGSTQQEIYDGCARALIEGTFEGYNATIFAYGQTGSGKTHTMGTGFDVSDSVDANDIGIVPRAVHHLFSGIEERRRAALEQGAPPPEFKVIAQFMELYNEEILDLLDTTRDPSDKSRKSHIKIHEDANGEIYTLGMTTRQVMSTEDTMTCLKNGALSRTTASTNMNAQSSRSHAIFTLHIKQQRVVSEQVTENGDGDGDVATETDVDGKAINEFETLSAKFHFVDLAGSERLKRTGATGERAKEGISINCGLLALGNVISALGDKVKKGSHVPYRDSKLTRLLQDSLGGNSRTVMIACTSPSDRDFMETLNTLRYANRARNIENKVCVNQDKTSRQLALLRVEVAQLHAELADYHSGRKVVDADGVETINDMFAENSLLQTENDRLRVRVRALHSTVERLTASSVMAAVQRDASAVCNGDGESSEDQVKKLIEKYVKDIEELRCKLVESEAMCESVQRSATRLGVGGAPTRPNSAAPAACSDETIDNLLAEAKRDLRHMKKRSHVRRLTGDKDNATSEDEKQDHEAVEVEKGQLKVEDDKEVERDDESEEAGDGDEDSEEEDDADLDNSSESGSEEGTATLHEDLAALTCEMSIKQKLIDELELSRRQLSALRSRYEHQLMSMQTRIRDTESERDRVLTNLGDMESTSAERAKKIRREFEERLTAMTGEVKRLQTAKREHAKLLRNATHYERQLHTLQTDLGEMKKIKVKLMKQISEDSRKVRSVEQRASKEIAQLRKEQRRKDNQIRSLAAETKKKDVVIRRKQEEVERAVQFGHKVQVELALSQDRMATLKRRNQKPMSYQVAGRVGKYSTAASGVPSMTGLRKKGDFSPKIAKIKWDALEKCVSTIVVKKQTLSHMEKDMERWLKQRASLSKKLEKFMKRKEKAVGEGKDAALLADFEEQIASLQYNVAYVQDNITECQSSIVQFEESKELDQEPPTTALITCASLDEAHYLLEHFIELTIGKGLLAAQKESENKELLAKLHQERMDGTFQRDMLQYLIQDKVDIEIDDSLLTHRDDSDDDSGSDSSSEAASPVDSMIEPNPAGSAVPSVITEGATVAAVPVGAGVMLGSHESLGVNAGNRRDKARRKMTTPANLLYVGSDAPTAAPPGGSAAAPPPPTTLMPPPAAARTATCRSKQSAAAVMMMARSENGTHRDSLPGRKTAGRPASSPLDPSPVMRRKTMSSSITPSSSNSSLRHSPSEPLGETTPPGSPREGRRGGSNGGVRDNNVFSRLSSVGHPSSPHPSRGVISQSGSRPAKFAPLVHTHTALGHSKAVLSVTATDDLMFSSSKDRTCKVWDLHTGEEILTLGGHPNNVVAIRYSPQTSLVYSVSTYFIKVWDLRDASKCIKTLTSSGFTNDGALAIGLSSRQVTCPPGETNINDIALNSTGSVLYTAAGNTVRIWDLRSFKAVGKLSGGHQAAVMVLAVDDTDTADGNICVVTGSKDHYIKIFDVSEDSVGVLCPKYNLEPPHYDGIQSLCLMGDLLFSGSRDTCIKKWDLSEQKLKQSVGNAHKDWICGLALLPATNCLLSGCRGGVIKLWNIDNCQQVGEMTAHTSPINSITTNSTLVFTASNDRSIRFWQPHANLDLDSPGDGDVG